MRTVDAWCFQHFAPGLVVNSKRKRPQAVCASQQYEGCAVMVFTISRNPDRSVLIPCALWGRCG
jgi:hypothetical protein